MDNNKGVTGILTALGEFVPCRCREHASTLNKLGVDNCARSLIFASYNGMSYVVGDTIEVHITVEQISWFNNNKDKLTELQYDCMQSYIQQYEEENND